MNNSPTKDTSLTDPYKDIHFFNGGQNFVATSGNTISVYDTSPFTVIDEHTWGSSNVSHASTFNRSDLAPQPHGAKFYICDRSTLYLMLRKKSLPHSFPKTIFDVKLVRGFIIIYLEDEVRVIHYDTLKKIASFPASATSHSLSVHSENDIATIVFSSPSEGKVSVVKVNCTDNIEDDPIIENNEISAHKSSIQCIELNNDGSLFATCSQKGTVIRVFDTTSRQLVKEVRRGTKAVTMYSISFSRDSKFLCCYSSSGTVHIFGLGPDEQNTFSSMYLLSYVGINYLSSEWSMHEGSVVGGDGKCTFVEDSHNIVYVITTSGKFLKLTFQPEKKKEPIVEEFSFSNAPKHLPPSDSVNVIVDRHNDSKLPLLAKRKYQLSNNMTVAKFIDAIKSKLNLTSENLTLLRKNDEPLPLDEKIADLHSKHKFDDDFLYIKYL